MAMIAVVKCKKYKLVNLKQSRRKAKHYDYIGLSADLIFNKVFLESKAVLGFKFCFFAKSTKWKFEPLHTFLA